MEEQRLLLASLMEAVIPNTRKSFRDQDVCKDALVAFCPKEMFLNTKVDLGRCSLMHDDKLAVAYRTSADRGLLGYEYNFHAYLLVLLGDVERLIKRSHQRLGGVQDALLAVSQVSSDLISGILYVTQALFLFDTRTKSLKMLLLLKL